MGEAEPAASERNGHTSPELRPRKVFAQNSGICMEETVDGKALNLGAGRIKWHGWLSVDLHRADADLQCDLRKLELPTDYADAAAAIHVLEHFYEWEARDLLTEWKRVLKPGGKLILELPCMDKILHYIKEALNNDQPMNMHMTWLSLWGDPKYQSVAMCHKWGYTLTMLKDLLKEVGFRRIKEEEPRYHFAHRDMRVVAYK